MAKLIYVLTFVAAAIAVTSAATQEKKDEIKARILPIVDECAKEFGISKEDLIAAKESKNIDAIDSCFYECFLKKIGFINAEGLFDVAVAKEKAEKFLSEPEDIKKSAEVSDNCASVNGESVSDGAKGCERAKLLAVCFMKQHQGYKSLFA